MGYAKNPKLEGSGLLDCRVQTGLCPCDCNQCFYNRDNGNAFYCDINKPNVPTVEESRGKIVRMNSGHDSNYDRERLFEVAAQYEHVFFNTSIPKFDFPAPVVFTANPKEEEFVWTPISHHPPYTKRISEEDLTDENINNIMYVRLRASSCNLNLLRHGVSQWTALGIPVVLTFMAYYDEEALPRNVELDKDFDGVSQARIGNLVAYKYKVRHINSYYCSTEELQKMILAEMKNYAHNRKLVTTCGYAGDPWCRNCGNCERLYWATWRGLQEEAWIS